MSSLLLVVSISGEDHVHFALTSEYALNYPHRKKKVFVLLLLLLVFCFVCLFLSLKIPRGLPHKNETATRIFCVDVY